MPTALGASTLKIHSALFLILCAGVSVSSSTSLIGFTWSALTTESVCQGQRCDTAACPCGCECGTSADPGLCFVPKRTIKYNQTLTHTSGRANSSRSLITTPNVTKPNGIVSVDVATGKFHPLYILPSTEFVVESAYDAVAQVFWMLQGSTLYGWDQKDRTLLTAVQVDISQCDDGSICFNELRWDAKHRRIVAVGIGFGGPQIAIVAINVTSGAVAALSPPVSRNCALYLQCSTFDPTLQTYYAWLACGSTPTASFYAIDLTSGTNQTILKEWEAHSVLGPSNFVQNMGVVTVTPDNRIVQVNQDNTTTPITSTMGSLPSSNGMGTVVEGTHKMAYVSLVDYSQNKLASIDLLTGNTVLIDLPYLLESTHVLLP